VSGNGFDDACEAYVNDVTTVLEQILGDALLGVYLHGSASTSGFRRERSDIDIIAVVRRSLTKEERELVATSLAVRG
jgi:predicted nucleotidyltransferase